MSEDNFVIQFFPLYFIFPSLLLSFLSSFLSLVDPRNLTQVIRLGRMCLYPLYHLITLK